MHFFSISSFSRKERARGVESHMADSHQVNGGCFDWASCKNVRVHTTERTYGGREKRGIDRMLLTYTVAAMEQGSWLTGSDSGA